MNFMQEGSELFNSLETFFLAQVSSELAVFDKDYFDKVWHEDILTNEMMLKRSIVRTYPLFDKLSDLAILSLVSEYLQTKIYKDGELMVDISPYAPTNKSFQEFMKVHADII